MDSFTDRFLHMEEGLAKRKQQHVPTSTADKEAEVTLKEFRRPRDALLCVVADYCSYCSSRLPELRKMLADPSVRTPELLDHKAHNVSVFLAVISPSVPHNDASGSFSCRDWLILLTLC